MAIKVHAGKLEDRLLADCEPVGCSIEGCTELATRVHSKQTLQKDTVVDLRSCEDPEHIEMCLKACDDFVDHLNALYEYVHLVPTIN